MVATAHYLGSEVALDVLKEGGTAVDAAIAAAATLGVAIPHMVGIGGDAFWLIHDARSGQVYGIDGSGPCGRRVRIDDYAGELAIPQRGPRSSITVPGAVDSWRLAHERFGSLPLARLLEPAVHYAQEGVPASDDLARWIADDRHALAADPGAADVFLANGQPRPAGTRLRQGALARTLARIGRHGPRDYYDTAARSIGACLARQGGTLAAEDFADYHARWVQPISTRYRGYDAFQLPPPSQGIAGLLMLNFLAGVDLRGLGGHSAAFYNAVIQAAKWSLELRDRHLCDPRFRRIPVQELLDPRAAEAARATWLGAAELEPETRPVGSDTTFICTADAHGNAVGLVQSLYFDFGACVLDPDSGVLLQNRGCGFSLDPASPNALEAGKQPASTLMSAMLMKDGLPYLVYGSQGGNAQPQAQTAFLTRHVDLGLDVQSALDAPRWLHGRSWGDDGNELSLESSAPDAVFRDLRAMGHRVASAAWPHHRMGTAQAIRLRGPWSEFLEGGADVRGEGLALGY
jgi:gamma-glutamyltranspeptidase/glutathione hydrolase